MYSLFGCECVVRDCVWFESTSAALSSSFKSLFSDVTSSSSYTWSPCDSWAFWSW